MNGGWIDDIQASVLVDNGWLAGWLTGQMDGWMSEWVGDGQVTKTHIRNNLGDLWGSWIGAWQTSISSPLWGSVQHPPVKELRDRLVNGAQ